MSSYGGCALHTDMVGRMEGASEKESGEGSIGRSEVFLLTGFEGGKMAA